MEMAGLAPSPYCGMILSDFGAEVIIIDRVRKGEPEIKEAFMDKNPFDRGKKSIRINLKSKEGIEVVRQMISRVDVLIEPYRPGVMEGLGLGPDEALAINEKLIYARLTGWGQSGPLAKAAGHDINYIGLSGALSLFKTEGNKPVPPANILGDFAAGGMFCAVGILLALIERTNSGRGQVVDVAMLDGTIHLATVFFGLLANKLMSLKIGTNLLDGGAHFYQVYETADGKFVAVGAIERNFYNQLLAGLGLDGSSLPRQNDFKKWPEMKELFSETFRTKTRDEWIKIFENTDACVTPVLELSDVRTHPHVKERDLLIDFDDILQPSPGPKLSRTPGTLRKASRPRGSDTLSVLKSLGYSTEQISDMKETGIVE